MNFSSVKSLVGWSFQMETVVMVQVQKYGSTPSAAFDGLSPNDLKAQAAMVMAKINRLPPDQRAVMWALHVQRETEMVYLTTLTPCRWGWRTDLDIIRKWATGEGPGCRDIGDRHRVSHMTIHRYGRQIIAQLEVLMKKAYMTLESDMIEVLNNVQHSRRLTA